MYVCMYLMYVCMYVFDVCMYVCMYLFDVCMNECMYVFDVCMYVCMYVFDVCMNVCMYVFAGPSERASEPNEPNMYGQSMVHLYAASGRGLPAFAFGRFRASPRIFPGSRATPRIKTLFCGRNHCSPPTQGLKEAATRHPEQHSPNYGLHCY